MQLWLIGFLPEDATHWQRLLTDALPDITTQIITAPIARGAAFADVFAIIHRSNTDTLMLPEGLAGVMLSHEVVPPHERGSFMVLALPLRFAQLLHIIMRWLHAAPAPHLLSLNADWSLNMQRRELVSTDRSIALTDKESELLAALLAPHAQGGVSREALLKHIWGYSEQIDSHTLETHIYRLRNKLQPALDAGQGILTTPQGYRLTTSS